MFSSTTQAPFIKLYLTHAKLYLLHSANYLFKSKKMISSSIFGNFGYQFFAFTSIFKLLSLLKKALNGVKGSIFKFKNRNAFLHLGSHPKKTMFLIAALFLYYICRKIKHSVLSREELQKNESISSLLSVNGLIHNLALVPMSKLLSMVDHLYCFIDRNIYGMHFEKDGYCFKD